VTGNPQSPEVALLNPFYWPEVRRGSERIIHDLAVDLIALGARPRLITSHRHLSRSSIEDGVPIVRHWRPPEGLLNLRKIEPHLSHLPLSYATLWTYSADVAHAFYPTDALAGIRWARRAGRVSVFSYMGLPTRPALTSYRLRKRILERVIGESDAVTVLSRAARDAAWRWFGVEARVIYPGVDLAEFSPGPGRSDVPTIACAGAVDDARKRIPLLLRAFARVRRDRPDARLLLTRPAQAPLARELQASSPGVELRPPSRDTSRLFREAWCSGLTSYHEAFGLVFIESLACGTPVFGARDGGVPEIVDRSDVGRLFDGDDERAVARAILETLELAEAEGTAAACRARAEAFDTISGAQAYLGLYRELMER
jgi:phosphatidylinositol alpha-mannosyltransferase